MKSIKKILSLVIALAMVLSIAPIAMASTGDDGMGGVETILFEKEDFQTPTVTVPEGANEYEITPGTSFNGWARNSATNVDLNFGIAKDGDNQFLSHWWGGTNANGTRPLIKSLSKAVTDRYIHLTYKFRHDGYDGFFYVSFGNNDTFIFNMNANRFYPGLYSNNSGTFTFSMPKDTWHDIEMFFDFNAKKVYCYINGVLMNTALSGYTFDHAANYTTSMGSFSSLQFGTLANNAGTAGKHVYIDDVALSTVDQKRICEIAAEKTTVPSAATGNITLPTTGFGGTTISWASSDTSLISNGGVVTRPESGDLVPVTLTATVTYGTTSVAYPYTVNVLPHTVPFYEDFEGAAIGDVAGYNSWTEGQRRGFTDGTLCWDWNIKQEAANKSANVVQTVDKSGLDKINANYVAREFDEISGKNASVTFKFKSDSSSNHLEFMLLGNVTKYFVFRMNDRAITEGGSHLNGGSAVLFNNNNLNVWHTARFDLDLVNGAYDLYVDGVQIADNFAYNGTGSALTSLKGVGLSLIYSNWGGVGSSADFDDIIVKTGKPEYAYSVVDFAFKGADGETSLYPEAGGSVSGVTINKYDSVQNAALIAAVYDGGKLTKASSPIDISGALMGSENTYTLNLPIESTATQIRVFALDKGTLVPLALDKVYEKRTPITVFIAGDSMAENVSGSTSSKEVNGETVTYAREGWGMRIAEQFADSSITVSNHAVGGRDTAEFVSEGRLSSILAKGQRGDFVFVSFGHNDDGADISLEDYRANLAAYSQAIKEKGMTPIFITSISRIATGADDSENWAAYDDDLDTYADAMVKEAEENGDVCLDLYTAFNNELTGKTYAQAREYYVPQNIDGTHLSPAGARLAAELIAELLSASSSTLKDLLK